MSNQTSDPPINPEVGPQSDINAALKQERHDLFDILSMLSIPNNASGRNKFREKWPEIAFYLFKGELIQFDNEGTKDLPRRTKLEEEAALRRIDLMEIIQTLEANSIKSGIVNIDFVGETIDRIGVDVARALYQDNIIERARPGLIALRESEKLQEQRARADEQARADETIRLKAAQIGATSDSLIRQGAPKEKPLHVSLASISNIQVSQGLSLMPVQEEKERTVRQQSSVLIGEQTPLIDVMLSAPSLIEPVFPEDSVPLQSVQSTLPDEPERQSESTFETLASIKILEMPSIFPVVFPIKPEINDLPVHNMTSSPPEISVVMPEGPVFIQEQTPFFAAFPDEIKPSVPEDSLDELFFNPENTKEHEDKNHEDKQKKHEDDVPNPFLKKSAFSFTDDIVIPEGIRPIETPPPQNVLENAIAFQQQHYRNSPPVVADEASIAKQENQKKPSHTTSVYKISMPSLPVQPLPQPPVQRYDQDFQAPPPLQYTEAPKSPIFKSTQGDVLPEPEKPAEHKEQSFIPAEDLYVPEKPQPQTIPPETVIDEDGLFGEKAGEDEDEDERKGGEGEIVKPREKVVPPKNKNPFSLENALFFDGTAAKDEDDDDFDF